MASASSQTAVTVRLAAAQVRSDYQYRTSFWMLTASQVFAALADLAAIMIFLNAAPTIGGWDQTQVLALYGLSFTAMSVAELFTESATAASVYVKQGRFDQLLTRPMSPLLQLVGLEFRLRRIGKVFPPVVVLVAALARSDVAWGWEAVFTIASALVGGIMIFSAIFITAASIVVVVIDAGQATNVATYGSGTAAQYPLHIYPRPIRILLGWMVPVAFLAYLPTMVVFDAPNPLGLPTILGYLALPVGAITLAGSLVAWRGAVNHYRSTGS